MRVVPRRSKRVLSFLFTDISFLNWLRIVWVLAIFWFEFGLFEYSITFCGWGDKRLSRSTAKPTRVLLITDPQVRNVSPHRYGKLSRFQRWLYHAGLRKSWKYAAQLKPHAVVFLGDILASGRKIKDDEEYARAVERFQGIFTLPEGVDSYFVPGNEDVGLNLQLDSARQARHHFEQHFGPANQHVSVSNHTFVFLDAPLLVEEDYHRAKLGKDYDQWRADDDGTVEFIRSFRSRKVSLSQPVILFTHIPLDRPTVAPCGPLREQGSIHKGAGPGYQNMLGKLTTQFIFENLKPSIVFSGDDRDYCDYTHMFVHIVDTTSVAFIREVTVKSFSPYKGIKNPGFHLLSLVPPYQVDEPLSETEPYTFTDSPCFLPSQSAIYTSVYLPLTILTFLVLLFLNRRQPRSRYQPLLPSHLTAVKHTHSLPSRGQHEKANGSISLFSIPETTHSSLDASLKKDGGSSITWPFSFNSRGRSRHVRSRSSSGRKEADDVSRFTHLSRPRRIFYVLRTTLAEFFVAILPSLALWGLITWWTLR